MLQSETIKKYDTYKDSGIEWIGEIPQEWNLTRLKQHYQFEKGKNAALYTNEYIGLNEGKYPVYSGQTENNGIMGNVNTFDYDESICVFTTTVGAKVMSPKILSGKFCLSQNCLIMKKIGTVDERFLYYQLLPLFDYEKSLIPSYMQPSLRISDLKRYVIISCEEQQRIAEYLDKKCGEIDRVVETEKAVIENLKEYKQSIITEAVTKGLDKTVPLKDSGMEWIGKIPQHWEVEKLKNLYSFGKGLSITKDDLTQSGISVISYGQIHSKTNTGTHIAEDLIRFVPENYLENNSQCLVNKCDFIFADTSEDIEGAGNCVFVDKEMTLFAGYHSIILRNKLSDYIFGKYLSYLFKTVQWRAQVRSRVNGIKVYSISQKILKEITVVVPKQQEQQQIAEYLDKKCSEIDKAIADKEQVIEKFTEYKKSLIYECVIGKRKVV